MKVFKIKTETINSWHSYHSYFSKCFGFPDYYGNNMDAWIDCMTYIDNPDECHPQISITPGDHIVLKLHNSKHFRLKHPEIFAALLECSAFVNMRRIEEGSTTTITVASY